MKIIRNAFILTALLIALPNPPSEMGAAPTATPSNWALMSAASSAYHDVKTFCNRQATVCDVADYLGRRAEAKAKYGMKLAYEWMDDDKRADDSIQTGTVKTKSSPKKPALKGPLE